MQSTAPASSQLPDPHSFAPVISNEMPKIAKCKDLITIPKELLDRPGALKIKAPQSNVYMPILSSHTSDKLYSDNQKLQTTSASDDEFSDDGENKLVIDEDNVNKTKNTSCEPDNLAGSPNHDVFFPGPITIPLPPHPHQSQCPCPLNFLKFKNLMIQSISTLTQ